MSSLPDAALYLRAGVRDDDRDLIGIAFASVGA